MLSLPPALLSSSRRKARVLDQRGAGLPGHMQRAGHLADKFALFGGTHIHQRGHTGFHQRPGLQRVKRAGIGQAAVRRTQAGNFQQFGTGRYGIGGTELMAAGRPGWCWWWNAVGSCWSPWLLPCLLPMNIRGDKLATKQEKLQSL
jgi:hypothetical protein